jgi:hypothetical protein
MLTSLARNHPLRGGIDVGLATEISPGESYGTALERAYLLECKLAKYPRIVVGDELCRYLTSAILKFEKDTTPVARAVTAIVQRTTKLIATDEDGNRILDYLGRVMVESSAPDHATILVQPAYDFVLTEQKRLALNDIPELITRYALLRAYFESRLALWGLGARKS